jgi:hypothetical protein
MNYCRYGNSGRMEPLEIVGSKEIHFQKNEVIRCIHIGLLCVQEDPASRPTMATVVLMLDSHSVSLQLPQQPAFLFRRRAKRNMKTTEAGHGDSSTQSVPYSVDDASITQIHPR